VTRVGATSVVAWGWIALGVLAGCGHPHLPNVLLITIDTLRADRLGCYGFGLAHTPAIDRLAREGVRCADATTTAPITLPAHSSIMTGLYPPAHGVRDNGNYALGPDAVTLAERLGAAGYRTAAFVSALVLTRRYGLDQGFEVYDDDLWSEDAPQLFMIRDRPAARTADRGLAWLDGWWSSAPRAPFFLWVHFFDPHQPYESRSVDLAALAPTAYDAEIAEADRGVGRLLAWLEQHGILDDTLVVLTADHGESLGEHGEPTHGIFVYDATIRVPLLWRLPGALPAGSTYTGPVRHIDIVPTALAALGLRGGVPTQGVNLLPAFQGHIRPPHVAQYAEARLAEEGFGMAPLATVRHDGRKWIAAPRPELYDLRADPKELHNVYPSEAARPLEETMHGILADGARRALPAPTREIDRETEEMLRALGYMAPPEQRAEMGGMDPKDGMPVYVKIQEARQRTQDAQWERARALLEEALALSPENATARNLLAFIAVRGGDLDEAERQYLASLAAQPRQHRVYGALGALALRRGDLDEAERRFREALEMAPSFVEAMSNLGFVAAARGDDRGAEQWYERAIAADPTFPHVYRRLADLYYDRKDWSRALDYYRHVLATIPKYFDVLIQAGNSARFLADAATAAGYYTEAGRVREDSWIPPYNMACLRAVNADPQEALKLLGEAVNRGFRAPSLLEANEDFETLHPLPAWAELVGRVRALAERRQTSGSGRPSTITPAVRPPTGVGPAEAGGSAAESPPRGGG
jgi:arylsulfatase A-like enzyme/Tfp pilus assembly protein PilF